eukprot:5193035-Amphidinium_carterae.1
MIEDELPWVVLLKGMSATRRTSPVQLRLAKPSKTLCLFQSCAAVRLVDEGPTGWSVSIVIQPHVLFVGIQSGGRNVPEHDAA